MVGVAQPVEHQVVALVAAGSSPVTHPIFLIKVAAIPMKHSSPLFLYAPVAQLDRAPDFESVGRRFESCRAYQKISR